MPKYCNEFQLHGHVKHSCWTIHLELFEGKKDKEKKEHIIDGNVEKNFDREREEWVRGSNQQRQECMKRRNKYKKDKYGHIEREIEFKDENPFNALSKEDAGKLTQ